MRIEPVITARNTAGSIKSLKETVKSYDIHVEGNVKSKQFHTVKNLLSGVANVQSKEQSYFPADWDLVLAKYQLQNKNKFSPDCQVIIRVAPSGIVLDGLQAFLKWSQEASIPIKQVTEPTADEISAKFTELCKASKHPCASLGIAINGGKVGDLVFELYNDVCPKTVANFLGLLQGSQKSKAKPDKTLSYIDTVIHRVVKNAWIQGGGRNHFNLSHD